MDCFCCMFWVVVLLYYEVLPNQLLLLSHLQWTAVTQSRWKPCSRTHCSTMMLIMSYSKPSPYFFLPIILVQVYLNSSRPQNAFPEVAWLVRCLSLIWHVWSLWWSLCCALVMSLLIVDLLSLSDGSVLFLKPNSRLFLLYGEILWPHDVVHRNSFRMQMAHFRINPRPFTCLMEAEIMKE